MQSEMARNPIQNLVIIWRKLKSSKVIFKPWFVVTSIVIVILLYFIYIGITLSLAHYYLTPSYQHFNITSPINVADCFVSTISFGISLNLLTGITWILRCNLCHILDSCRFLFTIIFLVVFICQTIVIIVNVEFFSDISTLSSDDISTGLILSAGLYGFICFLPLMYMYIIICKPLISPGTTYRYLVCVTSISLFFYFTLFVSVLATLHSPAPNTHKIWEDAVNYSYISTGNLIFLASQVVINTLIFSLLTLFYYSTTVQHIVKQHQDTSISGRGSGYGSTAAIDYRLSPVNMSSSESESEEDIPAHSQARRASDLKVAAKDHISFLYYDRLHCDCYGLEYAIEDHDIMLRIPKGAVAEGEKIHLEVGVAMYGPFIFPENTQPISPILWLYASEDVRMNDCFQLVLPHCYTGSVIPPEQISFAIADQNSTETTSGQAHYSFKLWGRGTKFFYEETYGAIQTNFCNHIFCIVKHTNYGHWYQDLSFLLARVDLQPSQTIQEFHFYGLFNITTNRIVLARKLQENGQKISSLTPFKFEDVSGSQPLIKLVPLTTNRIILLDPPAGEIKAHDIKYWRLNFNESKKKRVYLPIVRMQVFHTGPECIFPIKFTGCTSDSNLEHHLLLPADACNEDQVIEELRLFSSSGPTDLSPNVEFEQPDDLQQSVTRPSDLMFENMDEGAAININLGSHSDYPDSGISTRHVHKTGYFSAAEKTAHVPFLDHQILEVDCNGREYTNVDHDITLRIPEGAVAEGEKVHFEVGVAMYGPFIFPVNTQAISPILWLCLLEEDIELKKSFQVILPHYLTELSKERIKYHEVGFAKANHNTYTFVDTQMNYKFQHCVTESQALHASSGYRSYGVLVSKHCCFYCLLANKSHQLAMDAGYCLVRIESSLSALKNEVYFSAIYFLDTCLKGLEEQFPIEEGYQFANYGDFKFGDSNKAEIEIKVRVPSEHKKHCVIAMEPTNAKIKASDINFWTRRLDDMRLRHQRKMYPPRVKMTVILTNPDHILKLSIKVVGSSENNLDVELTFNSPSSLPTSPTSSVSSGSLMDTQSCNITCERPKLSKAFKKLLPVSREWRNIGTLLDLPSGILDGIAADEADMNSRLRAMLTEWLKQVNPPPNWTQLADAVEPFNKAKAEELRNSCVDLQDN